MWQKNGKQPVAELSKDKLKIVYGLPTAPTMEQQRCFLHTSKLQYCIHPSVMENWRHEPGH